MAINFPRVLPPVRWLEQPTFDLIPVEAVNRAGGSEQFMELGSPYWSGRFVTEPLEWQGDGGRAALHAWKDSLRGGKTFYGSDPFRRYPAAYPNAAAIAAMLRHAGGAFDGTARLLVNSGTTVQLGTLPTTYRISIGDMIELPRPGGKITLHQALEAVTAAAGVATITIDPPALADSVINSDAVRLVKARVIMVLKSGSFSAPAGVGKKSASFEGVETLT